MSLLRGLLSVTRGSDLWLRPLASFLAPSGSSNFHTCAVLSKNRRLPTEPKRWPAYNDVVYPPQADGEPPRPAEVCHYRANIKYSTKKLWYIACMIRGMSVDEAIKQLQFIERKGSAIIRETIEEAIELAVRDHNVEFRSNLWIADSHASKAQTIKGVRRHAKGRLGIIHYRYTHYMVRLREGRPPSHYYPPPPTGHQLMADYIEGLRKRTVIRAL